MDKEWVVKGKTESDREEGERLTVFAGRTDFINIHRILYTVGIKHKPIDTHINTHANPQMYIQTHV